MLNSARMRGERPRAQFFFDGPPTVDRRAALTHDLRGMLALPMTEIEALMGSDGIGDVRRRADKALRALERMAVELERFGREGRDEDLVPAVTVHESVCDHLRAARTEVALDIGGLCHLRCLLCGPLARGVFRLTLNLGRNAVNAVAAAGGGSVRIDLVPRTGYLVVDVLDTGPGLPSEIEDDLPQILEGKTWSRGPGGLGLASAALVAKDFGGSLRLLRSGSEGCHFRAAIPFAP